MLSSDTWLKLACSMMVNAVLFGIGAVIVLSVPILNEHAKYLIPAVVVLSIALSPLLSTYVARRMRVRNWGKVAWQRGDLISG